MYDVEYTTDGEAQLAEQFGDLEYYKPITTNAGGGAKLIGRKVHVARDPSLLEDADEDVYFPARIAADPRHSKLIQKNTIKKPGG
jgi:hypothetical protein